MNWSSPLQDEISNFSLHWISSVIDRPWRDLVLYERQDADTVPHISGCRQP